jgi:hypothetical protein
MKSVVCEPFKIEETTGKLLESLYELRKVSEDIFRRIETAS